MTCGRPDAVLFFAAILMFPVLFAPTELQGRRQPENRIEMSRNMRNLFCNIIPHYFFLPNSL
jgi:hypothetical protein